MGWKFINERILNVEIDEGKGKWALVIVYAPNEDDTAENKSRFYETLQRIIEEQERDILILGDLNARVGKNSEEWDRVIGKAGEVLNNNGRKLLNLCLMNNLVILNRMFIHKDIHKYTRVEPRKGERSIIDYT